MWCDDVALMMYGKGGRGDSAGQLAQLDDGGAPQNDKRKMLDSCIVGRLGPQEAPAFLTSNDDLFDNDKI